MINRLKHCAALACALTLVLALLPAASAASTRTVENSTYTVTFDGDSQGGGVAVTTGGVLYAWESGETPAKIGEGYMAAGLNWGVKTDNALYVWEGATSYQTPTKVMDGVLCAGGINKAEGALILKTDGTLMKVGGGNFANAAQVLTNVKHMDAGWTNYDDLYAVTGDGKLYLWDVYNNGTSFQEVSGMSGTAAIASTAIPQAMVIKQDGTLWVWGFILEGTQDEPTPANRAERIMLNNVVSVDVANLLAVTTDGTLYELGQEGNLCASAGRLMDGVAAVRGGLILKQDGSLWKCSMDYHTKHHTDFQKVLDGVMVPGDTPAESGPQATAPSGPAVPENPGVPAATGTGNPFADVPDGAYYKDAVLWALENGVTTGVTPEEFRPDEGCTRGQVVTFLWRAMGSPEPKTAVNPFGDVAESSPFYKAILWAQENGVTSGMTATSFNPGGVCTSGHVITFLWRAEGQPAASGSGALAAANPGKYYTGALAWAEESGILSDPAFDPAGPSHRADIVTYLYRDLA